MGVTDENRFLLGEAGRCMLFRIILIHGVAPCEMQLNGRDVVLQVYRKDDEKEVRITNHFYKLALERIKNRG